MSGDGRAGVTVVQSLPVWLPRTSPWLYEHVRALPGRVRSHIVCERTANLDQYHVGNLHCLRDGSRVHYWWDRAVRAVRVRRHLGHLLRVADRYGARVLHSHWGDSGWKDLRAATRAGLAHIVTFYGKDVGFLPRSDPRWVERYRELFRHADRILCEGPHMARCLAELGCPEERLQVLHLGVDVERIAFRPRVWRPGRPLRVLLAASFREKKGIPVALEALARFHEELRELEITIIGDASRDPRSHREKAGILRVLKRRHLESRTRLLGYQPHAVVLDEAFRHHLFLSPSLTAGDGDTEGGAPVTLIEMAATGMPVLSTTHGDIPSVVLHGQTGLLAAERDVDGLLTHLRWYRANPGAWADMVARGRRHIEREYNVRTQSRRLAELYASLAARN